MQNRPLRDLDPKPGSGDRQRKFPVLLRFLVLGLAGFGVAALVFSFLAKPRSSSAPVAKAPSGETVVAPKKEKSVKQVLVDSGKKVLQDREILKEIKLQEAGAPKLSLNGVMFSDQGSLALINGKIVREGDVVSGSKVMKIFPDRVKIEYQGRSEILKVH